MTRILSGYDGEQDAESGYDVEEAHIFCERLGSGDGERKTLLTRQMAFEPLPASVLFGLGGVSVLIVHTGSALDALHMRRATGR